MPDTCRVRGPGGGLGFSDAAVRELEGLSGAGKPVRDEGRLPERKRKKGREGEREVEIYRERESRDAGDRGTAR